MKSKASYKIWFFAVFFLTAKVSFADLEHFYNSIKGANFAVDSSVYVADDKFMTPLWSTIQKNLKVMDVVTLEMNEDTNIFLSTPENLTVNVEVTYLNAFGVPDSFATSLSINYDTARAKPFNYRSSLKFFGGYAVKTRILAVYYGGVLTTTFPAVFTLAEDIYVNRIYKFNCDSLLIMNSSTYDATNQRLNMSWAPFLGADEYDLEFNFYDHLSELVLSDFPSATTYTNFDFLFRGNATRVTVNDFSYAISLVYDTGYIFYRVRPVHYDSAGNRIEGTWSSDVGLGTPPSYRIATYPDQFAWKGHEPLLNWQYTAAYAEEGKRKEVTSYFDGTLRNRQSVTLNNSENKAIIGETMYDHQGRPAVTTLPAPIDSGKIVFYDLFNVNTMGKEYSRWDFDTGTCGFTPPGMDSLLGTHSRGSSGYYSSSNPDKNIGFNAYLPDAQAYPFTETEYTPDNTGRISRQSIAGKTHTLGSNHETRYFYGKPSQEQLDRLFGNEVGDNSHYLENMVIDANGQISVSYVDANGKTVATALAGQPPSNLSPLPSYYPADSLTINLLDGNSNPTGDSIVSSYSLLATNQGTYFFSYKLLPDDYTDSTCNRSIICADCLYDVLIKVTDGCGGDPALAIHHDTNFTYAAVHPFDTTCHNQNIVDTFSLYLFPGNYNITRVIKIDQGAINFYTNRYLATDSCLKTYQNFLTSALLNTNFTGCGADCQSCLASLGADSTFKRNYITELISAGGHPAHSDTLAADSIYHSAVAQCDLLCQPPDQCLPLHDVMLNDVSPGGQYGIYSQIPITLKDTATSGTSVFDSAYKTPPDIYVNSGGVADTVIINGVKYLPKNLNRNDFINNWKPSWAQALIQFHPEYCYYKYCELDTASNRYDYVMENTNTFAAALAIGFINPLGDGSEPYTINWKDPYFQGSLGSSMLTWMQTHTENWVTVVAPDGHDTILNLWSASALALNFEMDTLSGKKMTFKIPLFGNGCPGDNNMEWQFFRGVYMSMKQHIQDSLEDVYVSDPHNSCSAYAKCIGQNVAPCSGTQYDTMKARHFTWANVSNNPPWKPSTVNDSTEAQFYREHIKSQCDSQCGAYAYSWYNALKGCGAITSADSATLIQGLTLVCVTGCNNTHPMGSSTTPNLTPDSLGDRDFEDVIYRVTGKPRSDMLCDSLDITMPLPYKDSNGFTGPPITYYKPDTCVCNKLHYIDTVYFRPDSIKGDTDAQNFAHFLNMHFGGNLTDSLVNELLSMCNDTVCFFLPQPVELPIWLTCCQDTSYKIIGGQSSVTSFFIDTAAVITIDNCCINCSDIAAAYRIFILSSPPGTDTIPQFTSLLTSYLNQTFNFNLTYFQYIDFYNKCQGQDTVPPMSQDSVPVITTDSTQNPPPPPMAPMSSRKLGTPAAGLIAPLKGATATAYLNNPALAPPGYEVGVVDSIAPDSMQFHLVTSSLSPADNRRCLLVMKYTHSNNEWNRRTYNMDKESWKYINRTASSNINLATSLAVPATLDTATGKFTSWGSATNAAGDGTGTSGGGCATCGCDSIVWGIDTTTFYDTITTQYYGQTIITIDSTFQRVPYDTVKVICHKNCDSIGYGIDTVVRRDTMIYQMTRDTLVTIDTTYNIVPKDTIHRNCIGECDSIVVKNDTTVDYDTTITHHYHQIIVSIDSSFRWVPFDTVKVICHPNCDSVGYRTDTITRLDTTIFTGGDTLITIDTTYKTVPKDTIHHNCLGRCDSIVWQLDSTASYDSTIAHYYGQTIVSIDSSFTRVPFDTVKVICGNNCDSVAYTTDTIKRRDTTYTIHGDTIVTIDTTYRTVPKDTIFKSCHCDSLYQYDTAYVTDSVFINLVFVSSSYSVVTKAIAIDTALPFCLSSCDSIIYKPDTVIRIDTTKTLSASNFTIHYKQIIKFIPDSIIYKPCCDSIEYKTDTTIHRDTIYKDPYTDSTLGVRYTYHNVPLDTIFKPCTCDSLYTYDTTFVADTIYKKIGSAWTIYKIKTHTVTRRVAMDTALSYCLTACDSIIFKIDSIIARSSSGNADFDTVKYRRTIAYIPDSVVLKPCCDSVEYKLDTTVHSDTIYKDPYTDTAINMTVKYTTTVDTIYKSCSCDSLYKYDTIYSTDSIFNDWAFLNVKYYKQTRRIAIDTSLSFCLTQCDSIVYRADTIMQVDSSASTTYDTIFYRKVVVYVPVSIILRPCCDSVEYRNVAQVHSDTVYENPYTITAVQKLYQFLWVPLDTIKRNCLGKCDTIEYTIDTIVKSDTLIFFNPRTGEFDTIIKPMTTFLRTADTIHRKCLGPCDSIAYQTDTIIRIDTSYSLNLHTLKLDTTIQRFVSYITIPVDTFFRICPPPPLQYYLCNQPLNTPPLTPPSDTNPCLTDLLLDANYNAQNNYNNYLDSIRNAFTGNYVQHCLNIDDSFHLRMPFDEYHYTLYYYDQAENLVKTIPPQGVHPIINTSLLNNVKRYRKGIGSPVYPVDSLYSRYWFNSIDAPVQQQTPDGDTARYWYDRLGRMVLSQNALQKPYLFSYTMYDPIGRVIEVGQMNIKATNYVYSYPAMIGHEPDTILNAYVTNTYPTDSVMNVYARNDSLLNFLITHSAHSQITHTYYDSVAFANLPLKQKNLRKRISTITYQENALCDSMVLDTIYSHVVTYSHMLISAVWRLALVPSNNIVNYDNALHYTYDVDGNVVSLLTDLRCDSSIHQRFKRTDYFFDLVSGQINRVDYERDSSDQFIQQFEYDADNLISDVETSHDSIEWTHEAGYEYYSHGPLAREVLGRRQVQGVDYVYTLNGWIKGVNSCITNPSYDMGTDGNVHAPLTASIGRDAYGFTLNYFNGDYRPIGASNFEAKDLPTTDLFNGNISGGTYSIKPLNPKTIGYSYGYDQLNRITSMQAYAGIDTSLEQWALADTISSFKERTAYDENGNILTYLRHGNTSVGPLAMDSLNYNYKKGTNQLTSVNDAVPAGNYADDIDDEPSIRNYQYNAIGELAKDSAGKIDTIIWNVYGKVRKIVKTVPLFTGTGKDSIVFIYDPLGNRLEKITYHAVYCYMCASPPKTDTTKYIRDAQGNILAIYDRHKDTTRLNEWDLYGSRRLGVLDTNLQVYPPIATVHDTSVLDSNTIAYLEGQRQYELTNHLGNVLITINDRKWSIDSNLDGFADYYLPNILNAQDYYPFGMIQPAREYSLLNYKFGFNGKLHDDDVYGNKNCYDYGKRFFDPRLSRFLSIDPIAAQYPFNSPYCYAENSPISGIDLDGLEYKSAADWAQKNLATYTIPFDYSYNGNASVKPPSFHSLRKSNWKDIIGGTLYCATSSALAYAQGNNKVAAYLQQTGYQTNRIGGQLDYYKKGGNPYAHLIKPQAYTQADRGDELFLQNLKEPQKQGQGHVCILASPPRDKGDGTFVVDVYTTNAGYSSTGSSNTYGKAIYIFHKNKDNKEQLDYKYIWNQDSKSWTGIDMTGENLTIQGFGRVDEKKLTKDKSSAQSKK